MRILRGLSSYLLQCGCLVGVYETYNGEIVRLVDNCGNACRVHRRAMQVYGNPTKESAMSHGRRTAEPARQLAGR